MSILKLSRSPSHLTISCNAYNSVIGGSTWVWTPDVGQTWSRYLTNSTNSIGDGVRYKIWFDAGTYTLQLIGGTGLIGGSVDLKIRDIKRDTYDMYSALSANDVEFLTANIDIKASGLFDLDFEVSGVGTGGGFTMYGTMFSIWRTI